MRYRHPVDSADNNNNNNSGASRRLLRLDQQGENLRLRSTSDASQRLRRHLRPILSRWHQTPHQWTRRWRNRERSTREKKPARQMSLASRLRSEKRPARDSLLLSDLQSEWMGVQTDFFLCIGNIGEIGLHVTVFRTCSMCWVLV